MDKKDKLFDQFPPVSTKQWMERIQADLKGADFNEKLLWKSDMGFDVKPFYRAEDLDLLKHINSLPGEFPFIRGGKIRDNNWLVRQNIEVSSYSDANSKALDILMKGVDSLGFIIADPESVSKHNFDILLRDIHIEIIEISFLCNGKAKEILEIIRAIAEERRLDKNSIHGAIEADPLGRLMVNGKLCVPVEEGLDYLAALTQASSDLPYLRTVHINASAFCSAGADIMMQLAFALSMGNEYLAQLTGRGISIDLAATNIRFSFGIGSEYFPEIARLRAARLLWSVITSAYNPSGSENVKMEIHCHTSYWNKTVYDPYVNMLRSQTEAMSASLGGADSITVGPFDEVFRKPDEFSERIARNQQLILKEESYFDKVADPAAGSYYIENLTHLIAGSAWKLFVEIEENGGFLESLRKGLIQKKLSESAEKRRNDILSGKIRLLGTNLFPDLKEKAPANADRARIFRIPKPDGDPEVEPVRLFRGAEEAENERINSEK